MKHRIAKLSGILILTLFSCTTGGQEETGTYVADADYIQIVLFHLAQRCESCNNVEEETNALIETEYPEEISSGKIKFVSLNYQSKDGREAAKLLQASGQTLFVVAGDSINNLTSPAFMFASTHPDYYREALRKALDQALDQAME